MKTYIGIYSDAEPEKKVEVVNFSFGNQNSSKTEPTNQPKKTGIAVFNAENLIDAIQIAKEKNFSSFTQIDKLYYKQIDY